MTATQITNKVVALIKTYTFSMEPEVRRDALGYVVSFTMHTTAARSSTVVTRLKLIVAEISQEPKGIAVKKMLDQDRWPESRADIAFWRIQITIPVKGRKKL